MELNLKDIPEGSSQIEFKETAEELELEYSDVRFHGSVITRADLVKGEDLLVADGLVLFEITTACCRCLESVHKSIEADFRIVFQKGTLQAFGRAKDDLDDGLKIIDPDALTVDFGKIVREAVLLALPMKLLCSEDCKGLCPICGGNLNENPCDCERRVVDPRWSQLAKLKF